MDQAVQAAEAGVVRALAEAPQEAAVAVPDRARGPLAQAQVATAGVAARVVQEVRAGAQAEVRAAVVEAAVQEGQAAVQEGQAAVEVPEELAGPAAQAAARPPAVRPLSFNRSLTAPCRETSART